jgi:hypothetical protein
MGNVTEGDLLEEDLLSLELLSVLRGLLCFQSFVKVDLKISYPVKHLNDNKQMFIVLLSNV